MIFTDIKNRVFFLTKTNSTSFPIADIVIAANVATEHVESLINKYDGRWQFDDTNQTDLPIATATVTSGQKDYALTTSHLSVDRVEIKDSAGNWTLLKPIDQHEIRESALASYLSTSGIPTEYDKVGNSIFLYPTPNYTQSASLKLYFTRGPFPFDSGDASEQPGFNSLFHDLIPLWISYDFALANGRDNASLLFAEIQRKEQDLREFYGHRNRDERPRLTAGGENNR